MKQNNTNFLCISTATYDRRIYPRPRCKKLARMHLIVLFYFFILFYLLHFCIFVIVVHLLFICCLYVIYLLFILFAAIGPRDDLGDSADRQRRHHHHRALGIRHPFPTMEPPHLQYALLISLSLPLLLFFPLSFCSLLRPLAKSNITGDRRVIYSVHFYDPHDFVYQGIEPNDPTYTYPGFINGVYWSISSLLFSPLFFLLFSSSLSSGSFYLFLTPLDITVLRSYLQTARDWQLTYNQRISSSLPIHPSSSPSPSSIFQQTK